jgi:Mg-chelatase subunit ChlD
MMQATMWAHLVEGVLPVYMRLLNLPPLRQQGFQEVVQVRSGVLSGEKRSASEMQRALRQQLTHLNAAPYLRVVEEHREEIGRVSRLLEDLLPNHRGLRHRRGCRSGDRIDLRVAAQVEADRRLLERLWMQRKRRTLPDPAFVFVMDRSDSMKGHSRSGAAFASMVVVREACTRHKIPFAVIAFNDHPVVIHEWERLDDEKAQAALGLVLEPDNGTDLVAAVAMAGKLIAPRPERDRFVFVLTDGDVPEQQAVEVCALKQTIEETGVHFAAIGLDVDPTGFGRVFPGAPVIRQSSQLPAVMADLLVRVQTEAA